MIHLPEFVYNNGNRYHIKNGNGTGCSLNFWWNGNGWGYGYRYGQGCATLHYPNLYGDGKSCTFIDGVFVPEDNGE